MTPLRFHMARLMRNEAMLASLSVPQKALLADLTGRHVALVGNARSLADRAEGEMIDAADVVVRMNLAPGMTPQTHGTRTDALGLAVRLSRAGRARIAPGRILWMSPKRKRLDWATANSPGFYLHPLSDYAALEQRLGAPPSTGAMLIDLLARAPLASLSVHGFDFFASLSLSGRRTAEQVPHDFAAEAAMARDLAAADPCLRLIGV